MGDIISRQWIQGHCITVQGEGKKRIKMEERKKKRKGKLKD